MVFYDDEVLTPPAHPTTASKFDPAKIQPAAGNGTLAVCYVTGGTVIVRMTGADPDLAANKGIVLADGRVWKVSGNDNMSRIRIHKATGTPVVYCVYGR